MTNVAKILGEKKPNFFVCLFVFDCFFTKKNLKDVILMIDIFILMDTCQQSQNFSDYRKALRPPQQIDGWKLTREAKRISRGHLNVRIINV